MKLPTKLKVDAIVESICELRFETDAPPELVVGRLIDDRGGSALNTHRLPAADIPPQFAAVNPELRFQAWYDLRDPNQASFVRVGPHVVSCHRVAPYNGWTEFKPEIASALRPLFDQFKSVKVSRVGLRYINALSPTRHYMNDVHQLTSKASIAGKPIGGPIILQFQVERGPEHITMVRVASPNFATGVPGDASAVVDVDVSSREPPNSTHAAVMEWIEIAHQYEKEAFFTLLPPDVIERLEEKK